MWQPKIPPNFVKTDICQDSKERSLSAVHSWLRHLPRSGNPNHSNFSDMEVCDCQCGGELVTYCSCRKLSPWEADDKKAMRYYFTMRRISKFNLAKNHWTCSLLPSVHGKFCFQMLNRSWEPENFEMLKCNAWDMPSNFCFHVYAQNSVFIGENGNEFFWTSSSPLPVTKGIIELVPS